MPQADSKTAKTAALIFSAAVFLCAIMAPLPASAAWLRAKGEWFTAQTLYAYQTDEFFDVNGQRQSQPEFRKYEWNAYMEYGWSNNTTIGANLFLHQLENETAADDTKRNTGLADSELFFRRTLWSGTIGELPTRLSVQPLIKLPSAYMDGGNPRSGTDNFDAELRLQYGVSFPAFNRWHFSSTDIAYRKRFGEWRDQLKIDSTIGLSLTDNWTVLGQLNLIQRVEGNSFTATSSATVNDYDLTKAQLSVVRRVDDKTRVQFGAYRHLYARNTGGGEVLLFSIWREF